MENTHLQTETNEKKQRSGLKLGIKLTIILALSLLLLIPQAIIMNLVNERQGTEQSTSFEVSEKWGGGQVVTGPVLFIPGDSAANNVYLLSETLDITGDIVSRDLKRGIYDFTVYESDLELKGTFKLPKELTAEQLAHLRTKQARLLFSINDFRGFKDNPTLVFDGKPCELIAENYLLAGRDALSCAVDATPLSDSSVLSFRITAPVKGSDYIYFIPTGRTTNVALKSDCTTPSFTGRYLPAEREVTKEGFSADWKVLALNREISQVFKNQTTLKEAQTFGVELRVPVEQYQKTTRCIKYAYLIIVLTFGVVFFVEIRRQRPVHPVQYALVGLALVLFYTLLLSFSEHMTFLLAYLIASVMTVALISAFMYAVLRNRAATFTISGLLTVLYLFIYVILQLESYALLVGSLGVFVILAVAMFASQKINWYQKG